MSDSLILEKLGKLESQYNKTEKKIDDMRGTISIIAVQTERLNSMSVQVQVLWNKYDDVFKPDGVVSKIQKHQAGCPKETLEKSIAQIWVAVGLLAATVTGCLLKAFGGV